MPIKRPVLLEQIGEHDKFSAECPVCLSHNYIYVWYGKPEKRDVCPHFLKLRSGEDTFMKFRTDSELKRITQINHG